MEFESFFQSLFEWWLRITARRQKDHKPCISEKSIEIADKKRTFRKNENEQEYQELKAQIKKQVNAN